MYGPALTRVAVVVVCVMLASLFGAQAPPRVMAQAQQSCAIFETTGRSICGKVLDYWDEHGGLAQYGYPLSNAIEEVSYGTVHIVQYFERAVFEVQPDGQASDGVVVLPLGSMRYKAKYDKVSSRQLDDRAARLRGINPQVLSGFFSAYWKAHGGLVQQGYPLTGLIIEQSDVNGKEYVMQYFDKAVFEYHPENSRPYDVLLTHLGAFQYVLGYHDPKSFLRGVWNGPGVRLTAGDNGAKIELGSDYVEIYQPILVMGNRFEARGTYNRVHSGRPSVGDVLEAQITGTVQGDAVTFTITLPEAAGAQIGPFTVTRE